MCSRRRVTARLHQARVAIILLLSLTIWSRSSSPTCVGVARRHELRSDGRWNSTASWRGWVTGSWLRLTRRRSSFLAEWEGDFRERNGRPPALNSMRAVMQAVRSFYMFLERYDLLVAEDGGLLRNPAKALELPVVTHVHLRVDHALANRRDRPRELQEHLVTIDLDLLIWHQRHPTSSKEKRISASSDALGVTGDSEHGSDGSEGSKGSAPRPSDAPFAQIRRPWAVLSCSVRSRVPT